MPSEFTLQRAIARANRVLPARAAYKDRRDPRWHAIIRVGEFIDTQPEAVWEFARRWGKHPQADLRMAVAVCLVEHLLEHHFELLYPRVREAALESVRMAEMLWVWRYAVKNPEHRARCQRLERELRRHQKRARAQPAINLGSRRRRSRGLGDRHSKR